MRNWTILFSLALITFSSCVSLQINDGAMAYDLKKYDLATKLLRKEIEKEIDEEQQASMAFMIGDSYLNNNNARQAEKWLKQAVKQAYGKDAEIALAYAYQLNESYDDAIAIYNDLTKRYPWEKKQYQSSVKACLLAQTWQSESTTISINNLRKINSKLDDFSAVKLADNTLIFTSSRNSASGDKDLWTGKKYYDLFSINLDDTLDSDDEPSLLKGPFNTTFNEATPFLNSAQDEFYFTRCGNKNSDSNDYCSIYMSILESDSEWDEPERLKLFDGEIIANEGHPAISPDGDILVFSATAPNGYGGADLYWSQKNPTGWSYPKNLGKTLNTKGNEVFPYFDSKGQLYFSSDGHQGMGGLDIFRSQKVNNNFSAVENMRWPINSSKDDFGLFLDELSPIEKERYYAKGFFTSSRSGGLGGDDIYYFEHQKPPVVYQLRGLVKGNVLENPKNPNSAIIGTEFLANAAVEVRIDFETTKDLPKMVVTDNNGFFKMDITPNEHYLISAGSDLYFKKTAPFFTETEPGAPGDTIVFEFEIALDKVVNGAEIDLENVYFDLDDDKVRSDAEPALTELIALLEDNPLLNVQLSSHTDSRGEFNYNLDLSQRRSESVMKFLIEAGIEQERLTARGYGESKLKNACSDGVNCSDEQHQLNRRTTFKVLGENTSIDSDSPKRRRREQR